MQKERERSWGVRWLKLESFKGLWYQRLGVASCLDRLFSAGVIQYEDRGPESWLADPITHDKNPTPKPDITRPRTMVENPLVKVWIAPPIVNVTAPMKRVSRRPRRSPSFPEMMEVTMKEVEDRQMMMLRWERRKLKIAYWKLQSRG